MTTAQAGARGHPPTVRIEKKENPLKAIYERAWTDDPDEEIKNRTGYRCVAPGEKEVGKFWRLAKPYKTQTLIDFGCGTGRGAYRLYEHGLNVTMLDFAANALDKNIAEEAKDNKYLRFQQADLTEPLDIDYAQFGYCTDVLEHIPEEDVDAVLTNVIDNCRYAYFQICCVEDHFGENEFINDGDKDLALHLTVKPYRWWLQKLADLGVVIISSEDSGAYCSFYVAKSREMVFRPENGVLNVPTEARINNIRYAATLGLDVVRPYPNQNTEIMLLAGGPSLNDFEDEIREQREAGMPLITVNGAYNWAIDRGLRPSLQFLIDSRQFNKRFVEQGPLTDKTKYCVGVTADPAVYDSLPKDRTLILHTSAEDEVESVISEEFGERNQDWFPIPGGCTVTLRALAALRMLGYYKINIYGFDSCYRTVDLNNRIDPEHHAYKQEENDEDIDNVIIMTVGEGTEYEKKFLCAGWMAYQLKDFELMATKILRDVNLNIKGDGMIAYSLEVANKLLGDPDIEVEDHEPEHGVVYALKPEKLN
jgi:SAM-dependent methyltransferase